MEQREWTFEDEKAEVEYVMTDKYPDADKIEYYDDAIREIAEHYRRGHEVRWHDEPAYETVGFPPYYTVYTEFKRCETCGEPYPVASAYYYGGRLPRK